MAVWVTECSLLQRVSGCLQRVSECFFPRLIHRKIHEYPKPDYRSIPLSFRHLYRNPWVVYPQAVYKRQALSLGWRVCSCCLFASPLSRHTCFHTPLATYLIFVVAKFFVKGSNLRILCWRFLVLRKPVERSARREALDFFRHKNGSPPRLAPGCAVSLRFRPLQNRVLTDCARLMPGARFVLVQFAACGACGGCGSLFL